MTSRAQTILGVGLLLGLTVGPVWAQTAPTPVPPVAAAPAPDRAVSAPREAVTASGAAPAAPSRDSAAVGNGPAAAPSAAAPTAAAAKPPAPPADANSIRVEKTGGNRLFRITEGMLVEGQRQKPNAFYVLQRASAAYDWETLDENFLQRIIKATEKPPF